jgi:hypothetical protein
MQLIHAFLLYCKQSLKVCFIEWLRMPKVHTIKSFDLRFRPHNRIICVQQEFLFNQMMHAVISAS